MRAVGYRKPGGADVLVDLELPDPQAQGRDLLIQVEAVAINPVDTKIRKSMSPEDGIEAKVLGYDAAGTVLATGPDASLFQPGDKVWYAGVMNRPGSNAELQCVDERIVGTRPESLDAAQAAAMPLTTITAWELLFDRLGITAKSSDTEDERRDAASALLVIGGGGGAGSMVTQLAARLTGLTVIATASRDETAEWVRKLGADYIIDHRKPLSEELERIHIPNVEYIAALTHTGDHFDEIVKSIAPQGKLGIIDDPETLDINPLKSKCVSVHWEFMFARPLHQTADMRRQHDILNEAARLVDDGTLNSHFGAHYGAINAANLAKAHAAVESHGTKGKIVLEGFE